MDDMRYLEVLDEIDRELQQVVVDYNLRMLGVVGKKNLLKIRLEQNLVLAEIVKKHNRVLRFQMGEEIEPVAHAGEAVLLGVGGTGA